MHEVIGKKFGKLIILEVLEKKIPNTSRRCIARCECGKIKEFALKHVRYGRTVSCGCIYGKSRIIHGMSKSKLKKVFGNMYMRCYNPTSEEYHNYGARGITIHSEWLTNRASFFRWALENGYHEGLQIDRIDNNGNYEPINCRFVPPVVNANNKRNNSVIFFFGTTRTASEWSRMSGIHANLIAGRHRSGWKPADAIFLPVNKLYSRSKQNTHGTT